MMKIFDTEGVINRLNQLADNKGVSITKAMSDCGHKDLVGTIKNGSIPSVDKFLKIATYFQVYVGWLIAGEGKPNNPPQGIYLPQITNALPYASGTPQNTNAQPNTSPPPSAAKANLLAAEERLLLDKYRNLDEDMKYRLHQILEQLGNEPTNTANFTEETEQNNTETEVGELVGYFFSD
jgi:hypothetical protein